MPAQAGRASVAVDGLDSDQSMDPAWPESSALR